MLILGSKFLHKYNRRRYRSHRQEKEKLGRRRYLFPFHGAPEREE